MYSTSKRVTPDRRKASTCIIWKRKVTLEPAYGVSLYDITLLGGCNELGKQRYNRYNYCSNIECKLLFNGNKHSVYLKVFPSELESLYSVIHVASYLLQPQPPKPGRKKIFEHTGSYPAWGSSPAAAVSHTLAMPSREHEHLPSLGFPASITLKQGILNTQVVNIKCQSSPVGCGPFHPLQPLPILLKLTPKSGKQYEIPATLLLPVALAGPGC